MKTFYLDKITEPLEACVATIGYFDGVHRGHRFLISHVIDEAKRSKLPSMVITFDRHPREVLQSDYVPERLTTLDEKLVLLSKTGIDVCVVMSFSEDLSHLSAKEFMQQVLKEQLNVSKLMIGYDNRFGHNRAEGFRDYVVYGRELGIEVVQNTSFGLHGVNVSSSVVRNHIKSGEIEMANACLGYPYMLCGKVVDGHQEGRKMGFPTANLDVSEDKKLIPAPGVYAVRARLLNSMQYKRGMLNIGTRPTFAGDKLTIEVHILNFSDEIYGEELLVEFVHRMREEQKFDSIEALVEQLHKDEEMVDRQFDKEIDE